MHASNKSTMSPSLEYSVKASAKYVDCYIAIYHDCEGVIEKSVRSITVWRHKACQVMTSENLSQGSPFGIRLLAD